MRYNPRPLPEKGFRAWLQDEFRSIARSFARIDNLQLVPLAAEPERYTDGVIVYANGTDWNPGSGAGFYGRESGAWVKL